MLYRIRHRTRYRYRDPVAICHTLAHLAPRQEPWQQCRRFHLEISPAPAFLEEFIDFHGNRCHYFEVVEPHADLIITASSEVEPLPALRPLPEPWDSPPWEETQRVLARSDVPETRRQRVFVLESPLAQHAAAATAFVRPSFTPGRPILEATLELTQRIHREFLHDPRATTVQTPVEEVMRLGKGVCQDFAHLALAGLRAMGLAARYVSGYLETAPPPGQPRLVGADASHAWFSLFVPEIGWVDFDPTNGVIPGARHITLAWGRDYADLPPVKGVVVGGDQHVVEVSVDVER
ncbi:MAG: transglutaminase family protein [Magnetococcales bacterium]|nr:transglutaminase family protein [Magnetococcales bacterium]